MGWTLKEFVYELDQDPDRRVLFVEGGRDLSFWKRLVPIDERSDTVVYAISELEVPNALGGEKGRLIEVADTLSFSSVSHRVRFFADADCDRMLQKSLPALVTLTDFRDFEGYVFCPDALSELMEGVLQDRTRNAQQITAFCGSVARPIGLMRIMSERHSLDLPINELVEKRFSRFVRGGRKQMSFDVAGFLRVLVQNSRWGLSDYNRINVLFDKERSDLSAEPLEQIVQGKDICRALGHLYGVSSEDFGRHIYSAICLTLAKVRALPNVALVETWVRTA